MVDRDNIGESDRSGNPSIAWTCFDRGLESANQGFDENVIRSATATMYMGEELHDSRTNQPLKGPPATSCGRDRKITGCTNLLIH